MTHTPVTKEALVEEFKRIRLINGDEANGVIEDGTQLIQWLSTALDRYGTAQRAERDREIKVNMSFMRQWLNEERINRVQAKMVTNEELEHWLFKTDFYKHTPTETDNHKTV